ncbi:hypothetical protein [Vibrio vulnificus YJ016]|uniref:Uncharacterized protein n=1 Tax=Vibrio vulnificus (strain YJ016) TaxID=196600 RepID=Q7MMY9_VIBVY|nr:hypothetical protein [Vibrio vulnificus YJ016]
MTARIVAAMKVAYQPLGGSFGQFFRNRFRIRCQEAFPENALAYFSSNLDA